MLKRALPTLVATCLRHVLAAKGFRFGPLSQGGYGYSCALLFPFFLFILVSSAGEFYLSQVQGL